MSSAAASSERYFYTVSQKKKQRHSSWLKSADITDRLVKYVIKDPFCSVSSIKRAIWAMFACNVHLL